MGAVIGSAVFVTIGADGQVFSDPIAWVLKGSIVGLGSAIGFALEH